MQIVNNELEPHQANSSLAFLLTPQSKPGSNNQSLYCDDNFVCGLHLRLSSLYLCEFELKGKGAFNSAKLGWSSYNVARNATKALLKRFTEL